MADGAINEVLDLGRIWGQTGRSLVFYRMSKVRKWGTSRLSPVLSKHVKAGLIVAFFAGFLGSPERRLRKELILIHRPRIPESQPPAGSRRYFISWNSLHDAVVST